MTPLGVLLKSVTFGDTTILHSAFFSPCNKIALCANTQRAIFYGLALYFLAEEDAGMPSTRSQFL